MKATVMWGITLIMLVISYCLGRGREKVKHWWLLKTPSYLFSLKLAIPIKTISPVIERLLVFKYSGTFIVLLNTRKITKDILTRLYLLQRV